MSIDKKRILKNTVFLYLRMIIIMIVNLYVSREVLDLLGVVDYGIYNVVGGVVGMLTFLNSTLSSSSQRFFSIEIAKNNNERLKEWFSLNITVFALLILVVLVLSETIGLWFVNNKMTIPPDRIYATNIVYQLSIIAIIFQMFRIPYDGLIIAREKMNTYAYISILEAIFKIGIVAGLSVINFDRLITYGFLMLATTILTSLSYMLYCILKFPESHFKPLWDSQRIKELLSFSGWHFFGSTSSVIRSTGINLLLNVFFNPAVNAARAVAYQINSAVHQLSGNFFVAVKPQIYKSYAENNIKGMVSLIMQSTALCVFLVSIIVIPILTRTEYLLGIWLKEIPEYAVLFTQLVLINALFDSTAGPSIAAALATAKIKKYQMVVSFFMILNLPISYVLLRLGYPPQSTMITAIVITILLIFIRCYLLTQLIDFSFVSYSCLILKLIISSCVVIFALKYISSLLPETFVAFIVLSIISFVLLITIYLLFVFDKTERRNILNYIPNLRNVRENK